MRMPKLIVSLLVLSVTIAKCQAKEIVVGEGAGGWTLGVDYTPIVLDVGDSLTFEYMSGLHDVWSLPSPNCNFDTSTGASMVSPPTVSKYTTTYNQTGIFYYGCSINGHCQAGMLLKVTVRPANSSEQFPVVDKPPKGGGSCGKPSTDTTTGLVSISCKSPGVFLNPGDNVYPSIPIPNPYPKDYPVALETLSGEVTDANGRSVPLSEVYLHHIFGNYRFIVGEGAEIRLAPFRKPLPEPYRIIINGSEYLEAKTRYMNFHVINTVGVAEKDLKKCIECWCEDSDPLSGSIGCCEKCPTTASNADGQEYFFSYNITYKPVTDDIQDVQGFSLDVAGNVEYTVQQDLSTPGATNVVSKVYALDYFCPQDGPFGLLQCFGHMHIGAKSMKVYDDASGELICESLSIYGNETGVPGNEKGYLVGMSATTINPPRMFQPGQKVRVEATYDASQPYAGVMSLLNLQFTNFSSKGCAIDYSSFIPPPATVGNLSATPEQLEAELKSAIDAIPKDCAQVPAFIESSLEPCIPVALAEVMSTNVSAAVQEKCCKATIAAEKNGGINSLQELVIPIITRTDCICPLGEVLRLMLEDGVLSSLSAVIKQCTGTKTSSLAQGTGVALNAYFAPVCPELKKKLEVDAMPMGMTMIPATTPAAAPTNSNNNNNNGPSPAAAPETISSVAPSSPSSSAAAVGGLSSKRSVLVVTCSIIAAAAMWVVV